VSLGLWTYYVRTWMPFSGSGLVCGEPRSNCRLPAAITAMPLNADTLPAIYGGFLTAFRHGERWRCFTACGTLTCV